MPSLIQHQKFSKQCPCPRCDDFDSYEELLEAYLPPIDPYPCPGCYKRFPHVMSLEAHQREYKHAHCSKCDTVYPTRELHLLHKHSRPLRPVVTQYRCCDCERDFSSYNKLIQHLENTTVHQLENKTATQQQEKKSKKSKKSKCKKCKKIFKNHISLEQHLASVRHRPLSDIKCVADVKCEKHFNCPSAQLHHLEAGTCVSGMTKEKLDVTIAANDTGRVISSLPTKWLLEDTSISSSASTSTSRSPILTPTFTEFQGSYPSSPVLGPTFTVPSSLGFHQMALRPRINTSSQPCPRCPPSSARRFTLEAFQQHLSSSVHSKPARVYAKLSMIDDQISYHCPSSLMDKDSKKTTGRNFSTVSGLAQHLESGACDGGNSTFKRAVEFVQEEMKALGFESLKLLR